MPTRRLIPENPLEFIMRLINRSISRHEILESVSSYEIIEAYPEDKYFPSYLVYAKYKRLVFHILIAIDTQGDNVRIITTYRPNPEEWRSDLRTRGPVP
jgi:hypothetical protein